MKRGQHGAYDWRQTIGSATGRIGVRGEPGSRYYDGEVATRLGYVTVYSQGFEDERQRPSSHYRAIIDGVEYTLVEEVARTRRGLAIMAGKFIERLYDEATV